ncbi:MAG: hypothetical protein OXH04_23445 [Acidobacteria bacterium]|nr:hypothetical protein [Acidobacteriota bacterium]
MEHAIDRLQRFAVKLYLDPRSTLAPRGCIEIFHRWIQERAVPGLLIDVADYTHLTGGPRVVLVAHEGHYALDDADGRMGLVYTRRQPLEGTLPERLAAAAGILLAAAERLERDTADLAGGGALFLGSEIAVAANDRLAAPRLADAEAVLRGAVVALGAQLFGDETTQVRSLAESDRLGYVIGATRPVSLADLSSRVA